MEESRSFMSLPSQMEILIGSFLFFKVESCMRLGMSRNAYSINIYFETKVSVPSGNILYTIKIETPSAILDDVHIPIHSDIYIYIQRLTKYQHGILIGPFKPINTRILYVKIN